MQDSGFEKSRLFVRVNCLTTKTVQGTSLALQSVDNVHCCNSLSLGMLCVGNSIPDDVLEEDFQDASRFLVDETADTLHATTTSKTSDCRLCDTLDVVTQDLPVTLGASLSETFASFATTSHTETVREFSEVNFNEDSMIPFHRAGYYTKRADLFVACDVTNGLSCNPAPTCSSLSMYCAMRPLTEEETKAVLEKLSK